MEEEGLSCNGGGNIAEGGHLSLRHRCELAGNLHVFFELRDVVAAEDDGADWEREHVAHRVANVQRSGASGYTFPTNQALEKKNSKIGCMIASND